MKPILIFLTLVLVAALAATAAEIPPPWAYGFTAPATASATPGAPGGGGRGGGGRGAQPDPTMLHLEGSKLEFTRAQISDGFGPADWFPGDHPPMPDVVAHGRRPNIRACALCHYPNGRGRAENAGINGFTTEYFIQQLKDFAAGNRKSADSRKSNTGAMASIAKAMTEDEMKASAEYYGSMPFNTPWIKVTESATAPKTRINVGLFLALEGNETEPLGGRIIEVPVSAELTENYRDPRSPFIAYVPTGSVKKGATLATSGQCGMCHGADLRGMGPVPGIAGRSPSYMMRQMFDMKAGTRKGLWTPLMKPVVANLSNEDMTAIVAYVASLAP